MRGLLLDTIDASSKRPHFNYRTGDFEFRVFIAGSSADKTRGNFCCSQPDASADQDDDPARTVRPSSPCLYRLGMNRCDRRPSPGLHWELRAPVRGKSSRDTETSGPTVDKRKAGRQVEPRADCGSQKSC